MLRSRSSDTPSSSSSTFCLFGAGTVIAPTPALVVVPDPVTALAERFPPSLLALATDKKFTDLSKSAGADAELASPAPAIAETACSF